MNHLWYVDVANDQTFKITVMIGTDLEPPFASGPAPDGVKLERLTIRATNEGLRVSAVMPFNEGWMVWLHDT